MANDNWDSWGKDLDRIVDEAIHSGNYRDLSGSVTNTINQAIDEVSKAVNDTMESLFSESGRVQIPREYSDRVAKPNASADQIRRARENAARQAAQSGAGSTGQVTSAQSVTSQPKYRKSFLNDENIVKSESSIRTGGILRTVFGTLFSVLFGYENVKLTMVLGGLLILGSILLSEMAGEKRW